FSAGDELGGGHGIAAGEQRDVMPEPDELFGEKGDDAFRAAIEPRRATFGEGSDLGDSHQQTSETKLVAGSPVTRRHVFGCPVVPESGICVQSIRVGRVPRYRTSNNIVRGLA